MAINRKIYVSIATIVLLAVFLIAFLIYPVFLAIQKNSQELLKAKRKIILLSKETEGREKMEMLYRAYQQDFEAIEKVFIDPDAPLELISFLEETALNSQVELKISSVTKGMVKKDPWPNLLIQVSLTSFFPNFLEFLEKLENSPYLIEVLDLNVRQLAQKDVKSKEIPLVDTTAALSIKVFTK